tara:strand:- start:21337 stop:22083 length:747 start_codon:yes stop_codon:yes gene_type:complete
LRYFIYFSFNGKFYHGWQKQKNSITVQEKIEESLSVLLKNKIEVTGAGRTDAGVHAKEMVAHFDVNEHFENPNNIIFKLNQFLSNDISVKSLKTVKKNAHARFDAISRTYIYNISKEKDVFLDEYSYYLNHSLNIKKINEAIKIIINNNNFKCFTKSKTDVTNYLCNILNSKWMEFDNKYVFEITANRFLRNMVRSIVGTLIDVGRGKTSINNFFEIINSKNRSMAGYSVPAKGLFLKKITYPKDIFK